MNGERLKQKTKARSIFTLVLRLRRGRAQGEGWGGIENLIVTEYYDEQEMNLTIEK